MTQLHTHPCSPARLRGLEARRLLRLRDRQGQPHPRRLHLLPLPRAGRNRRVHPRPRQGGRDRAGDCGLAESGALPPWCVPPPPRAKPQGSYFSRSACDRLQGGSARHEGAGGTPRCVVRILHLPLRPCSRVADADVDNATAGQVLKRLKAEEFVLEQTGTRRQRGKNSTQPESMRVPALCVNKCVPLSLVAPSFGSKSCSQAPEAGQAQEARVLQPWPRR